MGRERGEREINISNVIQILKSVNTPPFPYLSKSAKYINKMLHFQTVLY